MHVKVYGQLSDTAAARRPTLPDALATASRWIDDDLRRQCLPTSTPPPRPDAVPEQGSSIRVH